MRKSARVQKNPGVYDPSKGVSRERMKVSYKESDDESNSTSDSTSTSGDDDEVLPVARQKISVKTKAEKVSAKSKPSRALTAQKSSMKKSNVDEMSLFDLVKFSKFTSVHLNTWIASYRHNRVAAMVDIFNFILRCSGAKQNWIDQDVDLDALVPEEVDELLLQAREEILDAKHSISDLITKESKSLRKGYIKFWESLTDKLRQQDKENTIENVTDASPVVSKGVQILLNIIEQLAGFSSMSVMNVRDAVTEVFHLY